jgi:hypothetical protein
VAINPKNANWPSTSIGRTNKAKAKSMARPVLALFGKVDFDPNFDYKAERKRLHKSTSVAISCLNSAAK